MNRTATEAFRLRRFVEELVEVGECDTRDQPVDLIDLAAALDCNTKAVWFRAAGPERAEVAGNVMGSRRRLALALGTDAQSFPGKLRDGIDHPIAPVAVSSAEAPVQEVVLSGKDADFTKLPVHLQHALDGAPYISAGIDFARDPATGMTNIGCRRLMLRGAQSAGIDLNAPSDLRALYQGLVAKGEKLPLAFAIGSHPADFLAAQAVTPPLDEVHVMGGVRGAPVPMVKCATIDLDVPADAEMVLEGYLDPRGLVEPEGPYGEYIGYYGMLKRNPVFHLTAITKRRDALFQTVTIGGKLIGRTDTAQLGAARTEAAVMNALRQAIRQPVAVCCTGSSGGMYNVRISIKQRYPGEARNAIAAVFCSTADVKHVIVVDDDVDVFSDEQVDWALATRFQADRDLVVASGFRAVPLDPSLTGARTGAKAGFDCTKPLGKDSEFAFTVPLPPVLPEQPRRTIEAVLADGPATYLDLMAALGTRDGREILPILDRLYAAGKLGRLEDGRYVLDTASTQNNGMRNKPTLTADDAQKMMSACIAEAQKNNWKVAIAIVDDAGQLWQLQRLEGAGRVTANVALGKARTAAMMGRPSKAMEDRVKERPAFLAFPDILPIQGGVPILSGGECVGAIGVSGVQSHEDEQVANAGVAALG